MVKSIAIVAGSYHKNHIETMVDEARSVALDMGMIIEEVVWVPGSMEMPLQIKRLFLRESIDGAVEVSHAFYEYDVRKYQGMSACPNTSIFDMNNCVIHNAYREESQSYMYPIEKSDESDTYGLLLDKVLTEIDDCLYSYSKITLNEAKLLQQQFNNVPYVSNLQIRI